MPGADYHLVKWATQLDYYRKLDTQSQRVQTFEIGKSVLGRNMILVAISAESTMNNLGEIKKSQKLLADPRLVTDRTIEEKAVSSKPVVLITGTIHSSETAASYMLMEFAHELASGREAWAREVLEKVVVLIVPSMNPDGIDIVAEWYEKSLGKPWEGSGLPRLYHHYAGHDTNRDFFALNLPETRNLSKVLYEEWFPTVCWDVHQMGSAGARLFVPPFFDPTNPNVDPRVTQSIMMIGSHMAVDLASAGKKGILHSAMYDNWWNGGNRTTPQRHNMVAILTEAASVRLASPIFFNPIDLKGATRGFPNHEPTVNFPDPWPGGWWRLRDIVDYELIAGRSLLTLVSRYGKTFQRNYLTMGRDQLHKADTEAPYGWLVRADQADPGTTWEMLQKLEKTGIEIHQLDKPITQYGITYPTGTWYLPARQPYRAHLKDMMERQKYPDRFTTNGQAEPPYDVAGWTLPLLMGISADELREPLNVESTLVRTKTRPAPTGVGDLSKAGHLVIENRSNDDLTLIQHLISNKVTVEIHESGAEVSGKKLLPGFAVVALDDRSRAGAKEMIPKGSSRLITTTNAITTSGRTYKLSNQRMALYQPWESSMNEGWTRLMLERLKIPYTTIHRDDILAGKLRERFDCIVFPSVTSRSLKTGYKKNETEPEFVGGLDGAKDILREFLESGGTLVGIENSCNYLIQELGLPVEDGVAGVSSKDFYGPGSIVEGERLTQHPLTFGLPEKTSLYFDRSLALKSAAKASSTKAGSFESVLSYGKDPARLLQSGWLLGPDKIAGLSAVGECRFGNGQAVLIAFPAQNRAQTNATFRILVNAIWRGGMKLEKEAGKSAAKAE
ncbi:MAG: M14 metallopeptidase family protein [bacterium]